MFNLESLAWFVDDIITVYTHTARYTSY